MSLEINNLLHIKEELEKNLDNLIYGSIEIRESNNNKYIYVHYRENNKLFSRYVDEYTDELYELILKNNIKAKEIKKEIKSIVNKLKKLNYESEELSKKVRLNIDFVRKDLIDTIYKQSILEGIATTEADTKNIIEGGIVNGMTSNDVMKILNLKHAWDFILEENVILSDTDFNLLCYINKLVINNFYYNAGILRSTPVKIGGTTWEPSIPIEVDIKNDINNIINKKESKVDKAIDLLLYVMKSQMFIDGNKRRIRIISNTC